MKTKLDKKCIFFKHHRLDYSLEKGWRAYWLTNLISQIITTEVNSVLTVCNYSL